MYCSDGTEHHMYTWMELQSCLAESWCKTVNMFSSWRERVDAFCQPVELCSTANVFTEEVNFSSHARVRRFDKLVQSAFFVVVGKIGLSVSGEELVHSGSASGDDCGGTLTNKLCMCSFLWGVPTLCLDSIVSPVQLHWVRGVCTSSCSLICYLHFQQNNWSLGLTPTTVTQGWNKFWRVSTEVDSWWENSATGDRNCPLKHVWYSTIEQYHCKTVYWYGCSAPGHSCFHEVWQKVWASLC